MKKKLTILELLGEGEENAKTTKELAEYYGRTARSITAEIHRLRAKGEVILSNNTDGINGYYLPSNAEEVQRFVRSMHSRMKNIKIATLSAEKYISEGR